MNPEKLALCTEKGIDMLGIPGGIPDLTAEDIAGALHKCTKDEYEVLSVKYMGSSPTRLYKAVMAYALDNFEIPAGNLEQLVAQAIREAVGDNTCPKCKGTKNYTEHGKVDVCPL